MTWLRTGEIGCSGPNLTEGHKVLILLVHHAHTKETMTALAEDGRLWTLNHAFLNKNFLPLFIASKVIKEGGSELTEVTTTHLHTTNVLQVVELVPFLFRGITESLDSLVSIVLL